MSELVMVATDLYVPEDAPLTSARARAHGAAAPAGLAHLVRFGTRTGLPARNWRAALAQMLGHGELAAQPAATIAAEAAPELSRISPPEAGSRFAWIATPVHLIATLSGVHLDATGLPRVEAHELAALVSSFNESFEAAAWRLAATRSGALIASGPAPPGEIETTDPARCLGASIADALPRGRGATELRRLASEIEMWLHAQPLNAMRVRERKPPLSALWLWGGGPLGAPSTSSSRAASELQSPPAMLFSDDPYVEGLAHCTGIPWQPTPGDLSSVMPAIGCTVVTVRALELSLEGLDRAWIAPAIERLGRGELSRVTVIANDRCVRLDLHDRWKLWRRHERAPLAAWR